MINIFVLINDSREAIAVVFWFCLGRAYRKRGFCEWGPETVLCKWTIAHVFTHTLTHMRCKDSHVVLWGRKLICQRPFRGSKNTWTGPVSGSTSGAVRLPALFMYLRVLCSVCCFCVAVVVVHVSIHTTWSHTWLAPAEVGNITARASWEREKRKILPTNRYMRVCEHVCMCVCICVCVEGANCAWRGLIWFSARASPSPSPNTYSNPHVKRAAHLFAFSLRQTLVGYAHLREPREPRQENRDKRTENRVPCVIHNNSKPYVKHNILVLRAIQTQISFQIRNLCFQLECLKNCATNTK